MGQRRMHQRTQIRRLPVFGFFPRQSGRGKRQCLFPRCLILRHTRRIRFAPGLQIFVFSLRRRRGAVRIDKFFRLLVRHIGQAQFPLRAQRLGPFFLRREKARAAEHFGQGAPVAVFIAHHQQFFPRTRQRHIQYAHFFAAFVFFLFFFQPGQIDIGIRAGAEAVQVITPGIQMRGPFGRGGAFFFGYVGQNHNGEFQPFGFMHRHHADRVQCFSFRQGGQAAQFLLHHFLHAGEKLPQGGRRLQRISFGQRHQFLQIGHAALPVIGGGAGFGQESFV